ncbi:hypothetical protein HKI87_05g34540 [Chloropicon roscoffensis]|uniref:F-box domain-containing protein n=1 Tax=Chloropicon roscoffensis TaxID=1461544 RepID=A0AAX4P7L5_9CHLO
MVAGAAEPTAKRAKADEAKEEEEEDPLVLRRNELILEVANARAEGTAKEDLRAVCATLEAKNQKNFGGRRLPREMWQKIFDENLHQNDLLALAMTCRFFRKKQKDLRWKVKTDLYPYHLLELRKSGKVASPSLGWFQWVCDTFKIQPGFKWYDRRVKGAVYEADLVNYAALQGSVEILRWLMEEKGWKLDWTTGSWAGRGGSVEVLEHMRGRGYEFDKRVCEEAARGGCLKALKFLRGLDPPCRWDEGTCRMAARGGHLEVLKWARAQEPRCPWGVLTCAYAAQGGHLEVLKWARSQDPPCPWGEGTCARAAWKGHLEVLEWLRAQHPPCPWSKYWCREDASDNGHQHVIDWIDQREDDESDMEYSDGD